jgi:TrmH family RNA methyltransferase
MPLSIVLVKPEISQNVGFVARSMKCFRLNDLRIVGRRYPEVSYAYKTGAVAREILRGAVYAKTLAGALADVHMALGFTRRQRDETSQRIERLCETVPAIDFSLKVALVFGCESQGLSREDCLLLNRLVKIDLPNNGLSLNLSHAVTVVLHEIFAHGIITGNPLLGSHASGPRTIDRLSKSKGPAPPLFQQREDTFQALIDFLHEKKVMKGAKARAQLEYVRRLWQRANPDQKEIDFLMGLITKAASR